MPVRSEPALLEREAELGDLGSALEDAVSGAGRLLVIEGSAGIGKTRLLDEARRIADGAGMRVLAARGTELERDFPFALVRQLFEATLIGLEPRIREELLAGAATPAGPVVGVGETAADAGAITDPSFATLNALYWLTSNLGESTPLLLAVDDAHWSDPPSLRFFRFLAARLGELPVLLALAARPAEPGAQPELLAELVTDPLTTVIRPLELTPAAVAELVREELGPSAEDAFCAACHGVTDGNPFMLRELLVQLAAEGAGGAATEANRVGKTAPATIRRAALLRLARLGDAASSVACAVAVLGDKAELPDAGELAGLDSSAASEAADALALAGILEPVHPLRFVHPITRTAVYAEMVGGTRSSAHDAAARLLGERGAEPERIAVHLLATDPAQDPTRVEILSEAANRALERAAPEAAAAYLRRALAEPPPARLRLDLLRLLLRAYSRARDQDGFEGLVESGAFEELTNDRRILLASALEFAWILSRWGQIEEVEALLKRASEVAIESGDRDLAARFQAVLANWMRLAPAEGLERLERFKGYIEPDTPADRLRLALEALWSLLGGRPRETALDLARRAVADARIWRENLDNGAVTFTIWALRQAGDLDGAERALAEQVSVVSSRSAWATMTEHFDRGDLALLRGQVAVAEAEARIPVEIERQAGTPLFPPLYLALLVEALVERDDLAGAEEELATDGVTGPMPDDWWFIPLLFSRARLRLAQGEPRLALDDAMMMGRISAEARMGAGYHPAYSYLALSLHAVGERDTAREIAEQEVAAARGWGLSRRIGIALRVLGLIEGGERGIDLLWESIEVLEPSPYRLEYARSLADYGGALRRANRRAEARESLNAALQWARGTGALAIARHAHEELEATGEKLRPLLAEGIESLTPSERRVAELAAEGHTNREVAQSLFLSVKTVETHLSHVYRKLDIGSRQDLAAALAEPAASGAS